MHRHAQLIFVFLVETGFHHVDQARAELLTSGDPPTLASQIVRIKDMGHCSGLCDTFLYPELLPSILEESVTHGFEG